MTMLFCPSKQKKYDSLTCIPIPPLVTRVRDFSPERLNTCMQGLSALLNTNISLFENLTSTGRVIVWCLASLEKLDLHSRFLFCCCLYLQHRGDDWERWRVVSDN